ncbi:elongation factor Ts [Alphaproteobacteria bacterium HT1-32]|nr:elongation factor Ts [Alphaproteobacteria bacterium HT1-32]|tara:strand:+ start:31725 stop:32651 length:927 start_codon:yes stop_codon:yes gene_type:complete
MAAVTAQLVKQLRESTGAGMMDCKKALNETDGDFEAAVDWLRTKGLAAAAKKAGRVASEGLVAVATEGNKGAVVEINSETDFVARNADFQKFAANVADVALNAGEGLDDVAAADYPGSGKSVAGTLTDLIAVIGENMTFRRTASISVENGVVANYVHGAVAPGLGKIGVLVALESTGDADKLQELGKQLAMHIAAAKPESVSRDDLDPALLTREREVLSEQARESGKPAEIIDKMVEGRIRKYYEEVCLLDQTFVIDGETKVSNAVEAAAKDAGGAIKVAGFIRFALGEGVEKKEEDFAAEVAATLKG